MSLEVTAMLSKVIYEAKDGTFAVAEFIDARSAKRFKASGNISTIGKNDAQQHYKLFGEWTTTPKYGETFKVIYCDPVRPDSIAGIVPFLANNVKGVGEVTARKLLETLGVKKLDDLIRICKEEPGLIQSYFKSKNFTAEKVITLVTGDEVYRGIMVFLHEHNVSPSFAKRIFEKYAADAVSILTENPYRLIADFRNVGFLRADAIAIKLGIDPLSPFRLEAAFVYALEAASDDGHCCLPRDALIDKAREVLGSKKEPAFTYEFLLGQLRAIYKKNKEADVHKFAIRNVTELSGGADKREILFYLPEIFDLENKVAGYCSALSFRTGLGREHLEKEFIEGRTSLEKMVPDLPWEKFSDEQRLAAELSVSSRIMILTGGPGCGKTFVLKGIHRLQKALGRHVALCAPTGLAAKRMTLAIGQQASTLHKLLGLGQRKNNDTVSNEIVHSESSDAGALDRVDVVIVDEASMLSLDLFHALLDAMGTNKRLILVGDVDQLPSVGAGNCLRDLIGTERIPLARLTKIFRQGKDSPIPIAAREIIEGRTPTYTAVSRSPAFIQAEGFALCPCSGATFFELLLSFMRETLPSVYGLDAIRDCQILVPMRKGDVGQENINKVLQAELNPARPDKAECALPFNLVLRVGDKVIQTRNNYDKDVFNGDLGFCKSIVKTKEKLEVDIAFDDKIVRLEDDEVDDLQLCYAMTIHKSQGSEFPLCIIPMFNAYYAMLDRNLLYTAVTRASKSVVLMGEEWAIKKSVGSVQASKRHTALEALIKFSPNA